MQTPDIGALFRELLADLARESEALWSLVAPLSLEQWGMPTPSAGWSIKDQIAHLAYFDRQTTSAVTNPGAFRADAQRLLAHGDDFVDHAVEELRHLRPARARRGFADARASLLAVLREESPRQRVPWFGPDMSIMSAASARLMETWAHGADIADALDVPIKDGLRLRHIAHLGAATRNHSFSVRALAVPSTEVRLELTTDDRELWSYGPGDAPDLVRGSLLEFCLVVTQRRHVDDTSLQASGPSARPWLEIAQAFAGPPTDASTRRGMAKR